MGWFETLTAAILGGSALGAALAGFFAYRRGAREKVLSALVDDLTKYNEELKKKCDRLEKRVKSLEAERQIPLTELTKMIVEQHTAQMQSMSDIATALTNLAGRFPVPSEVPHE